MIFSNTWVALATTTVLSCLLLTGCPEDYSAVLEENKKLAQQKARLESINQSMQADKKVFRQQVDRLNQEIQENEAKTREKEAAHEAELQEAHRTIEELEHRPNPYSAKIKRLKKRRKNWKEKPSGYVVNGIKCESRWSFNKWVDKPTTCHLLFSPSPL